MEGETRSILLSGDSAAQKTFLLSQNGTYLFSFCNGAFGSKWAGLWHNQTKFLEYFALRVNGVWLSPENFKSFRSNGVTAEIDYDAGQKVKVTMSVNSGNLAVKVDCEKESEIDMEPGVNIRDRSENVHGREYSYSFEKELKVKSPAGMIKIYSETASFTPMNIKEHHFPGRYANEKGYDWQEDEQEKFVPGIMTAKGRHATFIVTVGNRIRMSFEKIKESTRDYIRSQSKKSDWMTAVSLSSFVTKFNGKTGFLAGFPYFNQFWTRDFLWSAEPLAEKGFDKEVEGALDLIAKNQNQDGSMPNIVGESGSNADSTPLWIIAIDDIHKKSGKFLQQKPFIKAVEYGVKNFNGIVNHSESGTWMDSVPRSGAIEVQSLWTEAFKRASELLENKKLSDCSTRLWEKIESDYFNGEFFLDSLSGPYKLTANTMIPLLFDQASMNQKNKTLERVKNELLCDYGIRAVSVNERSYPEKYHERVWGLTTYWGSRVLDKALSKKLIGGFSKYYNERTLFGVPETISEGSPLGASSQLWSTAFLQNEEARGKTT